MTPSTARLDRPRLRIPDGWGWGVGLAIGAALISGLAIYLNAFAVKQVPDPAVYTTLKNGVAALLLIAVALAARGRTGLVVSRSQLPLVITVGIVGGSLPFVLFFTGLAQATAPSAAFIQKTLFLWVAALAVPFLGERLGPAIVLGLVVLLVGQALVLPPTALGWGVGETMILAATILWAIETVLVRRLLASIPSDTMAALRLGVGLVVLIGYLAVTGRLPVVLTLTATQWAWVLLTGVVLAGYVGTWFAALRRAPATVVTSVLVLGAVITGGLTAASKGTVPSAPVVVGYLLIVAAVCLLVATARAAGERLTDATAGGASPSLAVDDR
jgi:drug/metabolite transporter (DMT)-like permease